MARTISQHLKDGPAILAAILRAQEAPTRPPAVLAESRGSLLDYQRYLLERFGHIIAKPSLELVSKAPGSWLIVGDRRTEISSDIQLLVERYGLGVGMLVLHAQQVQAQHIPTRIVVDGGSTPLGVPTEAVAGSRGERILSVPIRAIRSDWEALAALNIMKPRSPWSPARIVSHERDRNPCFYCSSSEVNPNEVVIELEGVRHGLSRDYCFGFTFAPFGNPLTTVHFLAWDRARNPLNMNRVPMTVSDLVKLTRELNLTIAEFFANTGCKDFPVIDGISNGWAGNTIYHQHFQFFQPEFPTPILSARATTRRALIRRDDVSVERLRWPTPAYRIKADDALNVGLVGNDLAGAWRWIGGARKVPYKAFRDGFTPSEDDLTHAHTQNIYVPGRHGGKVVFLILRDRELVDFEPDAGTCVDDAGLRPAYAKRNIGVLEVTGTLIVDERRSFEAMREWVPEEVSRELRHIIASVQPDEQKVMAFDAAISGLFPG